MGHLAHQYICKKRLDVILNIQVSSPQPCNKEVHNRILEFLLNEINVSLVHSGKGTNDDPANPRSIT